MNILYDQQIFSFQNYGGVSRYFYELTKGIKDTGNKVLVDGKFSNNIYLPKIKNDVIKILPKFDFPYKNVLFFYLNKLFGNQFMNSNNYDIVHATYYHPYFLKKIGKTPYVITVYDMIHELYSDKYKDLDNKTSEYKKITIHNANQIITISKSTKNDLIKLYGIPDDKIEVIYLGNPLENVNPIKINGLPEKYLLFVGNRQGYKNFNLFAKAVSSILRNNNTLKLVCAGGGKFSRKEKELLLELKILDKVFQIGFRSDGELAYIYKNALVYVLPSLYEGFGLTALEAFSMGCPVVASDTSSIPEVCGNAVIYINPKDTRSINNGVDKLISNNKLRNYLIKQGFSQIKKFSWDRTVKETLKVYAKTIKQQIVKKK